MTRKRVKKTASKHKTDAVQGRLSKMDSLLSMFRSLADPNNPKFRPVNPALGTVYRLRGFVRMCKDGTFVDYDGHGCLAIWNDKESDWIVMPSEVVKKVQGKHPEFPSWATAVVWYNR